MAISVIAATTSGPGGSPRSITRPAEVQLNDVVVLHFAATTTDVAPTVPAGFNLIQSDTNLPSIRVYWKVVESLEPDVYTVTFASGTTRNLGLLVLRGDSGNTLAVDVSAQQFNAATTRIFPSLTTTQANTMMCMFASVAGNISSTPPGGSTEQYDLGSTRVYCMTEPIAGIGATGTRTATGTNADNNAVSVAFYEVAAPAATPVVGATQVGAHFEMGSDDGQLIVTQMGVHVEIGAVELRVSQLGVHIEIEEEPPLAIYQVRKTGGRAVHMRLPEEVAGYALDPAHSWWSVVVPEETENLVSNPSFESGTTGYTASNWSSTARVTGDAVGATRGAYAFRLTNTASTEATLSYTVSSQSAGAYTWSLDVYVPRPGFQLILRTIVSSVTQNKTFTFDRAGWQRIEVTRISLAASTWQLILVSPTDNTASLAFRTDGWQLENKAYSTTYADGDMVGWYDTQANQSYHWNGLPHASTSSRLARTGTGGKIVYFSDLVNGIDFKTTAIVGAGMGPVEMDVVRVGYEREVHRGVRFMPRDFTITGRVIACSYEELYQARNALINVLRPRTLNREPLILRYQVTDILGREASLPLEIICAYSDGLRGNTTNFYQESIGLQFHASTPFWMEEFDSAADLGATPYESLTSNRIIYRDADGVYQNLSTGVTDDVILAVAFDADGRPIAGGDFSSVGGGGGAHLGRYDFDLAAWDIIGPIGAAIPDDDVQAIHVIPESGDILIGGEFLNIGSVSAARVAIFDGTNWTELAGGFSAGAVGKIEYDRYSGQVYTAGGDNGGGEVVFRADLDAVSWTALPNTGLSSSALTILSTHDGYVWFGGTFLTTGDTTITLNRVARYNIDDNAWEQLDSGFNGVVNSLVQAKDGSVYAFGGFTRDGDNTYDLAGAARWNGTTWESVDLPMNSLFAPDSVAIDRDGTFWYGDGNQTVNTVYGDSYLIGWANGVVYPQPFVLPGDANGINAIAFAPGNEMIVAIQLSSATNTLAPKQVVVDVGGNADSLPVFVLRNKQTPLILQNLDAEANIFFRENFNIVDNERLFVNFSGSRPRFYSDSRPSLTKHLYTGASNLGSFVLRPGENRVMILCTGDDGDVAVDNSLIWRNRYLSSDAVQSL